MIAKLLEARLASGLAQEQGCEMKARCCDTSPFVDCRNGLCIYFQCVKRLHSVTLCQRYGLTARPAFSPCLPRNRYVTMNSNLVWLPSINDQASIVLCQTEGQLTASNGILSDLSDLVEMSKRNALLLGAKPVQVCARLGKDVVPEPAAADDGLIMRREFTATYSTAEVQVRVSWYPSRKNR